ncbi:hypothetical protein ACFYUD_20875 [Nocardia tengchongensis]
MRVRRAATAISACGNSESKSAGHYIQEDAPEQIIAAIREWVARRADED